jgi:ApaG protein
VSLKRQLIITDDQGVARTLSLHRDLTIGRAKDQNLRLTHRNVSRCHATLTVGDVVEIDDLDSDNGVFVNGARILSAVALADGDVVKIGDYTLELTRAESVQVVSSSVFLPEHSDVAGQRFAFAYDIVIQNDGEEAAQVLLRRWTVTDGDGATETIEGVGVVGKQPRIGPGESFEYRSSILLRTPTGTMQGTYTMERDDGRQFAVRIARFALVHPGALQ